jgi:hypothetical protein
MHVGPERSADRLRGPAEGVFILASQHLPHVELPSVSLQLCNCHCQVRANAPSREPVVMAIFAMGSVGRLFVCVVAAPERLVTGYSAAVASSGCNVANMGEQQD